MLPLILVFYIIIMEIFVLAEKVFKAYIKTFGDDQEVHRYIFEICNKQIIKKKLYKSL